MRVVTASHVKQNFGEVLALAQQQPVGVERHRKLVAALVPPAWLSQHDPLEERRRARAAQQQVEMQRLLRHQQIGIDLLCATPAQQRKGLEAARREVDRWGAQQLCSADYIRRWRAWLALPLGRMVKAMCSEADGWGPAMRQNSPFGIAAPA